VLCSRGVGMRLGALQHSGVVREILAKAGPLPLKDPVAPEEPRVVSGRVRRRLLLAVVALVGVASLAGQPPATELARAAGTGGIQIPVRWCAIKGTTAVTNPGSLGEPNTNSVLLGRHETATNLVWLGVGITFRSGFPAAVPTTSANFPVIDDPRPPPGSGPVEFPPGTGPGQLGDIFFPVLGPTPTPAEVAAAFAEFKEASAECEEEWDHLAGAYGVPLRGPIAFNLRRFVDASGNPTTALGNAMDPSVSFTLPPGAPFPSVLPECQTPPVNLIAANGAFMGAVDRSFAATIGQDARVVAHEFGHVLKLGHGNGLDDDGDGVYDQFCDPSENPLTPPASVMHPFISGVNQNVTMFQRGTARAIASVTPGSVIDPPLELVPGPALSDRRVDDALDVKDGSLDMTAVSMVVNVKRKRVFLSHTLYGLVPTRVRAKRVRTSYVAFLDLDSDRATGGRAAKLGFRTRFRGAELATRVLVEGRRVTPSVWRFARGRFERVRDRRVRASVRSPVGDEVPFPIFDVVSAQLPVDVVGRIGSRVRLQAITSGKGKWVDVLPGERKVSRRARPKRSVLFSMFNPRFPACTTMPKIARPGAVVTIKASGFRRRGQDVGVILGEELIARAELGRRGNMSIDVAIPETTSAGPRPIMVVVENSALTADCVLQVRR
jgi:hypothetical protein